MVRGAGSGPGVGVYPVPQRTTTPPSKVVSRFASGHAWTGGTDDLTTFLYGDRSYRGISAGTAAQTYLTSPTLTALDLSTSIIRLVFQVDDTTRLNQLAIVATTTTGNAFQGNVLSVNFSGEWATATMNRSQFTVAAGAPAWNSITKFDVRFKDNGNALPVTLRLAALELIPDLAATYPNGVFVMEADDGYASHLTQLRPVTDSLGIPVTENLIVERVTSGAAGMTLSDLKGLNRYSGWQMSCHANSQVFHDTAGATPDSAHSDFVAERRWLHDNGFHAGADHYSLCPGTGSPVPEGPLLEVIRQDFASARVNSGFYETVIPGDRHKLRSILFTGNTNAQLQSNIDAVAGPGGMLIFTVHEVIAGATNGTASGLPAIAAANLKTILQYAQTKGMVFRTRADALAGR